MGFEYSAIRQPIDFIDFYFFKKTVDIFLIIGQYILMMINKEIDMIRTDKFSTEMNLRVYNENGDYVEVCFDADGLGLVELRQVEADGTITNRIVMSEELADRFMKVQQFFLGYKNAVNALQFNGRTPDSESEGPSSNLGEVANNGKKYLFCL